MAKKKCSDLARLLHDIAIEYAKDPDVKNLDDVVARMQGSFPTLTRQMLIDSFIEFNEANARKVSELTKKLNAIRREPLQDKKLKEKIASLEKHLEEGTLPEPGKKRKEAPDPIKELQGIRDDLKKEISKSDPAVKKRLEESLETLNQRIDEGIVLTERKEIQESDAIERLRFEVDLARSEVRGKLHDLKPKSGWHYFDQVWNTFKNMLANFEFSPVLRQGGATVISHPIRSLYTLPKMFKAFVNEVDHWKFNQEILNRPLAQKYRKGKKKLFLAPIDGTASLNSREEGIQTTWVEKVPVIGPLAQRFNRATITWLNLIRADSFDAMYHNVAQGGNATNEEISAIADYVNIATGRGDLGSFESSAMALNRLMFSARYSVSRFQLLLGKPLWRAPKKARKAIATEYARVLLGTAVVLSLAELFRRSVDDEDKFDIEWDPRSSDFAKLRFGNRRVDFLAGIGQTTTLMSRVLSGSTKSVSTGEIYALRGEEKKFGRPATSDLIWDFTENKFSPFLSTTKKILDGKTYDGPVTYDKILKDLTIPITIRDIFEAFQEEGVEVNIALSFMAVFGTGLQTYSPKKKKKSSNVDISKLRKSK